MSLEPKQIIVLAIAAGLIPILGLAAWFYLQDNHTVALVLSLAAAGDVGAAIWLWRQK